MITRSAACRGGDTYKFYTVQPNTTNESLTLLSSSGWIYDVTNSIPYTMAWMSAVNAEQGTVANTSIEIVSRLGREDAQMDYFSPTPHSSCLVSIPVVFRAEQPVRLYEK